MSLCLGNTVISGITTPLNGSIAIGQIISSIIPLTDAGLHLLDGSVIQGGGIYDAFVQYIANLINLYPQCFTDETTWQNTVSSKGACGKFVYNSTNNTVRLPKITGFIEGTVDIGALGDLVNAGLPNITGNIQGSVNSSSTFTDGAFSRTVANPAKISQQSSSFYYGGINFDASRSNLIYGNSNTVQPQSIKVFYYIVVATTTKTDIEVNIDDVITDLNMLDNNVIHKTTNEYYTGQKNRNIEGLDTSTAQWVDGNSAILTQYDDTNFVNSIEYYYNIVKDNQNRYLLYNTCTIFNNGIKSRLTARTRNTANTANVNCDFTLYALKDGTKYVEAPASDINGSIITTISKSKSANGYFKLGNGLIIQWGRSSTTDGYVSFPTPFSNACTAVIPTRISSGDAQSNIYENASTTRFRVKIYGGYSSSSYFYWIAVGY